jgi:hypothetical protein
LHYFLNSLQRAKMELSLMQPFLHSVTTQQLYLPILKNLT